MTLPNDALMAWLRVQMIRLRSFDWGRGSWTTHWLKDGVAKFGSNYSIERLSSQLGVSEDDILTFIDSPPALEEMAGKSFTASWTGSGLTLSWLEEGSFLDAAHIVADCDSGPMTPDNLRPLCPNCHRVVDRLSNEQRKKLLCKI